MTGALLPGPPRPPTMSESQPESVDPVHAEEKPPWARRLTKKLVTVILLGATVFSLLSLGVYYDLNPSTDDAFVFGNVVGIACQVEGPISAVHIVDNEMVKKGDLLIEIDPTPFQYTANLAKAEVARSEAALEYATLYADRVRIMAQQNFMSQNDLDDALAKQMEARADLEAARAAYDEAALHLSWCKVYAPVNGVVTNFRISPGVYVYAGEPIFALIDTDSYYVGAFFRENLVRRIFPNQTAKVTLNMYPGEVFEGRVEGVGWGTFQPDGSSTRLLPDIQPTVDWVRLAMRFQVRINMEQSEDFPLRLGSRAVVTVHTTDQVEGPSPYPFKKSFWDWLPFF